MELAKLSKRIRFFRQAVCDLLLSIDDLWNVVSEGSSIRHAAMVLFKIAMDLSERYPNAGLSIEGETVDRTPGSWLTSPVGQDGTPIPPVISSQYIRELAGRALLAPGELNSLEVQELGASIISHLAMDAEF